MLGRLGLGERVVNQLGPLGLVVVLVGFTAGCLFLDAVHLNIFGKYLRFG